LWLQALEVVAAERSQLRDEGGFTALKLRLGRDRASDDAIRAAVGDDIEANGRFQPRLTSEGLAWVEEPIVYDNLDG
jgi:mandelate racemase